MTFTLYFDPDLSKDTFIRIVLNEHKKYRKRFENDFSNIDDIYNEWENLEYKTFDLLTSCHFFNKSEKLEQFKKMSIGRLTTTLFAAWALGWENCTYDHNGGKNDFEDENIKISPFLTGEISDLFYFVSWPMQDIYHEMWKTDQLNEATYNDTIIHLIKIFNEGVIKIFKKGYQCHLNNKHLI